MKTAVGWCGGAALAAILAGPIAPSAEAQDAYPNGPVTMVVNTSPGSSIDRFTREVAAELAPILGESVVVDNREGGNGTLALQFLQSRPADGQTMGGWSITYSGILAQPSMPFGPDDFTPVCRLLINPYALWIKSDRFGSLDEFIAEAKAQPGGLRVGGGGGPGSSVYVVAAHIQESLGIEFTWVPFDGSAEADLAVMGGDLDATVGSTRIPEGAKLLAVTGPTRDAFAADTPTFAELGYEVPVISWRGVVVKAGTPESILAELEAALTEMAASDAWKAFAVELKGTESVLCGDEFRAQIAGEIEDLRQIQ